MNLTRNHNNKHPLNGVLNSNHEFGRINRKAKVNQICRHLNIKKNHLEYDEIGLKHKEP